MAYTKEQLEPIIKNNISLAGVMRDLGLRQSGGSHAHLTKLIRKFDINTSHFRKQASNFGPNHKGGYAKKSPNQVLILRKETEPRTAGTRLRKSLIESGVPDKCNKCGQESVWLGNKLTLTPDHKNGKFWDNRPENLELLCPNCHSQTPTFSGRNKCVLMAERQTHRS